MEYEVRTYTLNQRGLTRVRTKTGSAVLSVVGGDAMGRAPSIVVGEPVDGAAQERLFSTLASSLRMPENSSYVGSVRTGPYEISHVYEVKNGP